MPREKSRSVLYVARIVRTVCWSLGVRDFPSLSDRMLYLTKVCCRRSFLSMNLWNMVYASSGVFVVAVVTLQLLVHSKNVRLVVRTTHKCSSPLSRSFKLTSTPPALPCEL